MDPPEGPRALLANGGLLARCPAYIGRRQPLIESALAVIVKLAEARRPVLAPPRIAALPSADSGAASATT
jgi:hypothetical protein